MQDHVKGVVHRGSFTLDPHVGTDGLGLAEEHHGLVDQVRSEIEEHATAGFGTLAPGVVFELGTEAVEVRLEENDPPQFAVGDQALKGKEVAVPAPILIDGKESPTVRRDIYQFRGFGVRGSERLVDDHVSSRQQTLSRQVRSAWYWAWR